MRLRWRRVEHFPVSRSSRSGRTAVAARCGSVGRRVSARPCCSPSITTVGVRRTRRAGSTTTRRSSTLGSAGWTRCRRSAPRFTMPVSRTSCSPWSGCRPGWPHTCGPRSRSSSSTGATARSRPASTTRDGRRSWRSEESSRSTTCSPTRPTVVDPVRADLPPGPREWSIQVGERSGEPARPAPRRLMTAVQPNSTPWASGSSLE